MPCKGICHKYKVTKTHPSTTRYSMGQKRCNVCSIFIKWDGNLCPCCHYRLRTRPRYSKGRSDFIITNNAKRF